jgi:uncharacterized membrane protein
MTDTGPSDAAPRRWPRWKGILFVVSLALNLLVVGVVATAAIRHRLAPPPGYSQATVVTFARTLPEPRRRELWNATRAERLALRPYRAALRQARAEVRSALVAEPFDVTRFKAAHERLLDAELGARKVAHLLFESVALRMTPDERRAFARWQPLAERPWRRQGFRERDADADGDLPAATEGPAAPVTPGGAQEKK